VPNFFSPFSKPCSGNLQRPFRRGEASGVPPPQDECPQDKFLDMLLSPSVQGRQPIVRLSVLGDAQLTSFPFSLHSCSFRLPLSLSSLFSSPAKQPSQEAVGKCYTPVKMLAIQRGNGTGRLPGVYFYSLIEHYSRLFVGHASATEHAIKIREHYVYLLDVLDTKYSGLLDELFCVNVRTHIRIIWLSTLLIPRNSTPFSRDFSWTLVFFFGGGVVFSQVGNWSEVTL